MAKNPLPKREEIIALFEIYSPLLSIECRERFLDYYYEDCSLSELAENYHVSRSAIHDGLSKTVSKLNAYENKMGLLKKKKKLLEKLSEYPTITNEEEKKKAFKELLEEIENAI